MAAFKSDLGKVDTRDIQPVITRAPADTSGERDKMLGQAATIAAKAGGKAYAESQAAELSGADMSLSEANQQADIVEAKIDEAFAAQDEVGPPTKRSVEEIKDAQLSEFATNDRTLLALRDRGTLSSTEARARRTLNLKRALSNPINSLFRQDFVNAAKDLTGGGAMDDMFQETPAEKESRIIREKQVEAVAKFEAEAMDWSLRANVSLDVAKTEMREQKNDIDKLEKLKAIKADRELTSIEYEDKFATGRSASGREVSSYIREAVTANPAGLEAGQMAGGSRMIESMFQKQLNELNIATGLTGAYRDAERQRLQNWRDGQLELLNAHDKAALDKSVLTQMEVMAQQIGWANMGEVMALKAIDPRLFDIFLKSGGNIGKIMDATLGDQRGTDFIAAAKKIRSLGTWAKGGKPEEPGVVADFLNTPEGVQYLSETVEADGEGGLPKVSPNTAKVYHENTEKSLKSFTTAPAIKATGTSKKYRGEVIKAMDIAGDKFMLLNKHEGGSGEISVKVTKKRGRRSDASLTVPEGLADYVGEIQQLYRVIEAQPWTWEHVQDQYLDAADAFSGMMRGEWQPEMGSDATERKTTARGSRIKHEAPADTGTKLDAPEATGGWLRPEDKAELQALLDKEVPTPGEEDRLAEMLQQRVDIQNRKRQGGGMPLDPRPQLPEQNKVEIGRHGDSNWNSISQDLFKYEGGFQQNPKDKGNYVDGELIGTNMGISAAQYERLFGSKPTVEKLKALTKEEVDKAYKEKYWDANRVGEMPPELQEIAMNMFVMTSPKNVIKAIQRASGAKEDGILGPQTLKAMRGTTKEEIWEEYHNYLKSLKGKDGYSEHGDGWRNRYEAILNG